ncbi:hypothetical protein N186_02045 [Thermofilum adornatum]|uniref:Type III-B CRISPR module RAMP protein Cmr1 n=1 Tax=Thermofilum adornatum TaxID=1365176 RepID=S5ZCS2_9CREN|nr:type III-B CRISPR module RAMP protein Cmr1 [Thermofilum adornatum]AGT34803.1 hypothetical protein N186_02045 [Thermofilum adornatum]
MATLSTIQNKILEKENLLISVKARLLYPHIGGYTSRPYDPETGTLEPPRPTEIKALWRWWARSLLSGAYGGTKDYKFLDKEIGEFLGRTEETPQTSLFHLSVTATNYSDLKQQFSTYYNYLKRKYLNNERDLQNLIKVFFTRKHNITRLFLVSLGAQREQKISEVAVIDKYNNLHITIDLLLTFPFTQQRYPLNMLRFALWSFFVSLILGSVGYGSRRGLGSIIVQEIKENPDLLKYYPELGTDLAKLKEIIATLNNGDREKIEKKLDELVNQAYEVAKGFKENFKEDLSHIVNTTSFPEVPSVIPNGDFFKMEVYLCSDPSIALQCISKSTLKNEWLNTLKNELLNVDEASETQPIYRSQLHTWILGLPRSSKGKGYYLDRSKRDPGRRVSAIQFKLWQNKNKTFVIVYGFLSKDWKIDKLNHFAGSKETRVSREDIVYADGQRFKPQNNNELFLSKAFEAAWSFISKILNKCCSGGKNGRTEH